MNDYRTHTHTHTHIHTHTYARTHAPPTLYTHTHTLHRLIVVKESVGHSTIFGEEKCLSLFFERRITVYY